MAFIYKERGKCFSALDTYMGIYPMALILSVYTSDFSRRGDFLLPESQLGRIFSKRPHNLPQSGLQRRDYQRHVLHLPVGLLELNVRPVNGQATDEAFDGGNGADEGADQQRDVFCDVSVAVFRQAGFCEGR